MRVSVRVRMRVEGDVKDEGGDCESKDEGDSEGDVKNWGKGKYDAEDEGESEDEG